MHTSDAVVFAEVNARMVVVDADSAFGGGTRVASLGADSPWQVFFHGKTSDN
jgi:hypothetical protein